MKKYLENITPDSFSGTLFAFEGIKNTVTLINGPTGCKFYHSATSDNQEIRQFEFDPLNYPEVWYFGQPRIPCTYLDKRDYVYGSRDKIEEAIKFLESYVDMDLIAIVNSPGASLIGDDLKGIVEGITDVPIITVQTPGYSKPFCEGFDEAILEALKTYGNPATEVKKKTVNLFGISIHHKHHIGDIKEITKLLSLCDIEVNTVPGAGSSLDEIKNVHRGELNIIINPEYAKKSEEYLKSKGMKTYVSGPLIGFEKTEEFINHVCKLLGANPKNAIEYSRKGRATAYIHISRLNSLTGRPKSTTYSVEGTYSTCHAYVNFLSDYFGMIPSSINVLDKEVDTYADELKITLNRINKEDILNASIKEATGELVFGSGNTIARLKLDGKKFSGVEISLPSIGYVDVIPKTHMGAIGALLITEQVINGLQY